MRFRLTDMFLSFNINPDMTELISNFIEEGLIQNLDDLYLYFDL